jgi:hypothetical protein
MKFLILAFALYAVCATSFFLSLQVASMDRNIDENQSVWFKLFGNFWKNENRKNQAINWKNRPIYHFSFKIWILNKKPVDKSEKPSNKSKKSLDFLFSPKF